ncbi:hypothetical protein ACU4GD_21585 [Cupriavidus basilensis]
MGGYRWGQNKDQNGSLIERDDFYWIGASFHCRGDEMPALGLTLEITNYDSVKEFTFRQQGRLPSPWQSAAFIAGLPRYPAD